MIISVIKMLRDKMSYIYFRKLMLSAVLLLSALIFSAGQPRPAFSGIGPLLLPPLLARIATETPDEIIQIIVQKQGETQKPEIAVQSLNGEIIRELSIINGFVAKVPAASLHQLAQVSGIHSLALDAPVAQSNQLAPDANLIQDLFEVNAYNGDDGTRTWNGSWEEIGENDGPDLGNIVVARFLSGSMQGLRFQGVNQGAERSFNLVDAESATLSFIYRRKGLTTAEAYLTIEISADNGRSWSELGRISGPETDTDVQVATYDISPFLSGETKLRFITSPSMDSEAKIYLDNIAVAFQPVENQVVPLPYKIYIPNLLFSENDESLIDPVTGQPRRESNAIITVRDEFSTISYGGDDGTNRWTNEWQEIGESNGAGYGNIGIYSGSFCTFKNCLLLSTFGRRYVPNTVLGVAREADLNGADSAKLSFSLRRYGAPNGTAIATLTVSKNGGKSWSELASYAIDGYDSMVTTQEIDISKYTSAQTQVRFTISSPDEQYYNSYIFVDDIQIEYNGISGNVGFNISGITETISDDFNSSSYNNSSGTIQWDSSWAEVDDDGSPHSGNIQMVSGWLMLGNDNVAIQRSMALESGNSVVLNLGYIRRGFDSSRDSVDVDLSSDGGSTWQTVYTISGPGTDVQVQNAHIDISAYSSDNLLLRLRTSEKLGYYDRLYIDQLTVEYGCEQCIDTSVLESTYVQSIGADLLWNTESFLQGQEVAVAVVDSGIAHHNDLLKSNNTSRIIAHVDMTSASDAPDDFYGHGTHVAGTIGGNGSQSDRAYVGVAPQVNLVDVKVIDDNGVGSTSNVVAGLQWVLENKDVYNIRVVNLSLNSSVSESYNTSPLNAALEILWFNKIVVVVSAGNNGNNGILYPPANDPFVITVGAADTKKTKKISDDSVASFSASGQTQHKHQKPEIIAPGTDIVSLLSSDDSNLRKKHPSHAVSGKNGTKYFRMSGTSMASAVVAGAVALLLQDEPELTPDQVKYRLMSTAVLIQNQPYLRIDNAVNGNSTESANTGLAASPLLWTGPDPAVWDSVNWSSVNWSSVNWSSVNWSSVNWSSDHWDD